METNYSALLQLALETLITVGLPILLAFSVKFLNAKINEANTNKEFASLETVVNLIRQFVQAAEMNGLKDAIENEGAAKKRWVIDMVEAELARRNINIDLDVLDALIESQVKEAIKDVDALFPAE